jgi:hypothetical protein
VFCTEGERDADALVALGLCATCNAGGAGKWQVGYTSALTGANVVVIADKDAPGRSHAAMVLEALTGKATSVRVLELPDRDGHPVKDAADWIAAGGTAAELQALVETALEWQPPAAAEAPAPAPEQSELELRYGPTHNTRPGKKGVPTFDGLNEPYWAGLHAHRHTELFEPMEKTFYRYDPDTGLYTPVTSDTIKTEVGDMLLEHGRSGCDFGDAFIAERTDRQQGAIVNQLRGIVEKRDAFTKRPQAIHLANGMIVFTDGVPNLVSFSPKFRSRNQSPIAYDPAATCPRFLGELVDPAVHAEDVAVIQKYMGLCLLGRNLIQRFMILDGKEGRGKTQLANVFQFIVGQVNASQLRTEHLADRFEVYRFLRKTLLVGVDVPANFLGSKGAFVIKGLVGGDFFDAERKGSSDCFPVAGEFCVVITSNTRLRVKLEGDVGAWRRRMLIVRYEAPSPAKKIPDFGKVLVDAEGPGILNWALQGLDALIKDVSETGDIRLTQRQKDSVISLLSESDSLRVFLEEKVTCEIGNDLTVSEIVQAYAEFCPTRGWNPMSITVVERDLPGLMLELFHVVKVHSISRIGSPQQRGFNHVRFK